MNFILQFWLKTVFVPKNSPNIEKYILDDFFWQLKAIM